jgi:pimeloyl-ACP methyl ester carboxylesterase
LNTISGSRNFIIHWPTDYTNTKPYRLIFNLHGAGGSATETSGNNYGLWSLANGSTIFVSLSAVGGNWNATADTTYASAVLKAVVADLCIDTTRIMLEGFSMGAAMARVLGCSLPGVFRAIIGHPAGGVTMPSTWQPIPYLGSLGLSDIMPNSQSAQTDQFAKWDGCTIETLPTAAKGSHVCTPYKGCAAGKPVVWCSYDGGHTPSPTDSGETSSWMPSEVWPFFSQF